MSRLEGERGPRNRGESIAAFRRMLGGCATNNSARLADDAAGATTSRDSSSDGAANAKEEAKGAALRKALARRRQAHKVVSELMGTEKGSYMLNRERDISKVFLGRRQEAKVPPSVGVVRVSAMKV